MAVLPDLDPAAEAQLPDMKNPALIIFAKNPAGDNVKTRLAETIGRDAAKRVYRQLVCHTLQIAEQTGIPVFLFYDGQTPGELIALAPQAVLARQQGSDLGERMWDAFKTVINIGFDSACIIGSDCPGISSEIITSAFDYLKETDVVIGPALDGGYYLLAIKQDYPSLFKNMQWSQDSVFTQTLQRVEQLQLHCRPLQPLRDIDDYEDLKHYHEYLSLVEHG